MLGMSIMDTLTETTTIKTDLKTLFAVLTFAVLAAFAYFSLKADNARLTEKLAESIAAQHLTEARLAAVERWQIETLTTLRIKGVIP